MTRRIITWAVWAIITGLYAYMIVAAAGSLSLLPKMVDSMGMSMTGAGWFWLIFGVAVPPIAYALALVFTWRRGPAMRLLALATGLCAAAAINLEVLLLVPQSSFFG